MLAHLAACPFLFSFPKSKQSVSFDIFAPINNSIQASLVSLIHFWKMKDNEASGESSSESFAQRMLRMQGWTEGKPDLNE